MTEGRNGNEGDHLAVVEQGETMHNGKQTALVLSGGGARAAYQVGVLRGLFELGIIESMPQILVGSSAGSINSGALAAHATDPEKAISTLERVWSKIEARQVFRTDIRSLGSNGVRWAWDLTLGGILGNVRAKALLDTAPLRKLLERAIPFRQIDVNIQHGTLTALVVAATDLHTAEGVLFLHAHSDVPAWHRQRWVLERTPIRVDHLLASSAIPVFFPPAQIDQRHLGDGCIRNTMPLRPAIHLGANRIIAIGVRGPRLRPQKVPASPPSIARIAGVLLDAVMMDSIESDVEHAEHINTGILETSAGKPGAFRRIEVLWMQPSADISAIAAELEHRIPNVLRYLMRGLGSDEAIIELASYLLFDSEFCNRLIELGRTDVAAGRAQIEGFFDKTGDVALVREAVQ